MVVHVGTSQLCGACHNVKVDMDGDGLSPVSDDNDQHDRRRRQLQARRATSSTTDDGTLDDLVLQTTYDEWQDYVAGFDGPIVKDDPRNKLDGAAGLHRLPHADDR